MGNWVIFDFFSCSNYSVNVDYVPADLSKVEDIEKLCKEVFRIYPDGIDILVNNAGKSD
jgi:short-subunit dehydrogenase